MLITEQESRHAAVLVAAQQMMIAARTAPKGRGGDRVVAAVACNDTLMAIVAKMEEIGQTTDTAFFLRDAKSVRQAEAIVLLGSTLGPLGLNHCGFCGMKTCENKNKHTDVPCAFNTIDLGIALGSAVSVAAHLCVDSRILFSAGKAALALGLLGNDVKVAFGIPLSCTGKSPFFDR